MTITERAAIKRINRKLAHEHRRLFKSRSWGERSNLGTYHVIDVYRNEVVDYRIEDLNAYAGRVGVLAQHERVAS